MTTMRWFRTGGPGRGAPARRFSAKQQRLAIMIVALGGLTLPGCAALGLPPPCGSCGWLSRVFHPRRAAIAADCCAPGADMSLQYGAPGAVITPGVVPAPPGTINQLEPVPSASPAPSETGANSRGAGKANYETYHPADRSGSSRGPNLARAFIPSEPAQPLAQRARPAQSTNPLDDLPPLNIPGETPRTDALPPEAAEAGSSPAPGLAPEASGVKQGVPLNATTPSEALPQAQVSPSDASPQPDENSITVTPGIKRFQGLEPKLAGGSLPSLLGLDWLADKGYKTILDLRDPNAEQPAYIAEVTKRGMRYLALPITPAAFDADHINRFNAELDQSDARPLYFFDTEGDRAGGLWYVRRLTVDHVKVDAKTAVQEAKELGLSVHSTWVAATSYIEHLAISNPASSSASEAASTTAAPQPAGASQAPRSPTPESKRATTDLTAGTAAPAAQPESALSDPTAWRPFAAMILSTLGVPLAYWSRSVFSLGFLRASPPAPARLPKSLPVASDA
jgi:protein tyrosine phosphatase (PTP) superfamily phosphohydrolase (DUF442 family)